MSGQYVAYTFFRVDPAWRRLPVEERMAEKTLREVARSGPGDGCPSRLLGHGVRPDSDFFSGRSRSATRTWASSRELNATPLAGGSRSPTRPRDDEGFAVHGGAAAAQGRSAELPYLVVYPL